MKNPVEYLKLDKNSFIHYKLLQKENSSDK